jgi:hypothetical protein
MNQKGEIMRCQIYRLLVGTAFAFVFLFAGQTAVLAQDDYKQWESDERARRQQWESDRESQEFASAAALE